MRFTINYTLYLYSLRTNYNNHFSLLLYTFFKKTKFNVSTTTKHIGTFTFFVTSVMSRLYLGRHEYYRGRKIKSNGVVIEKHIKCVKTTGVTFQEVKFRFWAYCFYYEMHFFVCMQTTFLPEMILRLPTLGIVSGRKSRLVGSRYNITTCDDYLWLPIFEYFL